MNQQFPPKQENKVADTAKKVAKNQAKKQTKKVAVKALSAGAKKIGAALVTKASPIILVIIGVILLLGLFIALITPDMTMAEDFETEGAEKEAVRQHLLRYSSLAAKYNISDPRWTLMFDMAVSENQKILEYSPDENAFHLFTMHYIEYIPTLLSCPVEETTVDEEGNETVETTYETVVQNEGTEVPQGCSIQKVKEILFEEHAQTKDAILELMMKKEALVIEGEEEPKRTFIVDDVALFEPFYPNEPYVTVEINYSGKEIEQAMSDAEFNKDEKEHVETLLEMPEAIDALFEEYNVTLYGNYLGSGAYCVQDGIVDNTKIDSVLSGAGKFKGHIQTFLDTAQKYNIDPVLMIAIALHETGNGTSNAVVNKNNPGGLMDPSTGSKQLYVFSTLDEGIEAMGRTLSNRINKDGLTTIDSLGAVYAPVGAANDPNNLNQHWVGNIGKNVSMLGGLTMNCTSYSSSEIIFNGDVSEVRKQIASVGTRWIGNSIYVFGGGRSQSDINRGWFDCSSFVHWAYKQAGIDLGNLSSTSTETLNKMGTRISMNEIQVGDLIFWDTYKKDGHVAIYIGNGQFIGAQSSTGVAIVNVNNSYWKGVYSGHVRRLINN
ncbi:NlpC/P60 family protein [Lysinibacillus sphaericus]|uniref:C40 family peptidase n=1 Tax=Lysinibacillus sphaericus TaxID=1421 RepID=UPI003F795261